MPNNPANQKPVGTGPYKLAEWNRGASLRLTRNESYWEPGKPYLDTLVYAIVPQPANRATGLETGELDFVVDFYLSKADAPRLLNNSRLQSKRGQGSPNMYFLSMNTRTPALAKPEARQALAFAINRATIVQQVALRPGRQRGLRRGASSGSSTRRPATRGSTPSPWTGPRLSSARPGWGPTPPCAASTTPPGLRWWRRGADHPRQPAPAGPDGRPAAPGDGGDDPEGLHRPRLRPHHPVLHPAGDPAIGYHRLYVTTENRAQYTNATSYSNPRIDDPGRASAATTPGAGPLLQGGPDDPGRRPPLLDPVRGAGWTCHQEAERLWRSWDSRDRWADVWLNQQ